MLFLSILYYLQSMTRLHTVLCQMVPGTLVFPIDSFPSRTVVQLEEPFSPLSQGLYRLEKQVLSTTMSPSAESSIKIIHRNRHGILCLYVCAPVLNRYSTRSILLFLACEWSNGHYPLEDVYTHDFLGEPLDLQQTRDSFSPSILGISCGHSSRFKTN